MPFLLFHFDLHCSIPFFFLPVLSSLFSCQTRSYMCRGIAIKKNVIYICNYTIYTFSHVYLSSVCRYRCVKMGSSILHTLIPCRCHCCHRSRVDVKLCIRCLAESPKKHAAVFRQLGQRRQAATTKTGAVASAKRVTQVQISDGVQHT